jgi:hypothetical protein
LFGARSSGPTKEEEDEGETIISKLKCLIGTKTKIKKKMFRLPSKIHVINTSP